jgi:hypothetical protein
MADHSIVIAPAHRAIGMANDSSSGRCSRQAAAPLGGIVHEMQKLFMRCKRGKRREILVKCVWLDGWDALDRSGTYVLASNASVAYDNHPAME